MKYPPMPNQSAEQELRELLQKAKTEEKRPLSSLSNDPSPKWKELEDMLGKERVKQIMAEEGYDWGRLFKRAIQYFTAVAELAETVDKERTKLEEILNPLNAGQVGEFLIAHLRLEYIIEKIITDNLRDKRGEDNLSKAKLSFYQKLKMLPTNSPLSKEIISLLHEINTLRNEYAHNIKFDIRNFEGRRFKKYLKDEKTDTPEDKFRAIMKFVAVAEFILLLQTPSLKDQMQDVVNSNPILRQVSFGNGKTIENWLKHL